MCSSWWRTCPEVTLQPGDVLVAEGTVNSSIWVVLGGRVSVAKQGVVLATLDTPGTIIGEVSVLLQTASTATVTAADRTTARSAADGAALLLERPQLLRHVATGLARRLDAMTTYLVDLEAQYGDAPAWR